MLSMRSTHNQSDLRLCREPCPLGHSSSFSAKRTAVIDDQSDYFEVDTNTWLSDQVGGLCTSS
eukprot:1161949-Pelagomonas_calceolata.AAC.8